MPDTTTKEHRMNRTEALAQAVAAAARAKELAQASDRDLSHPDHKHEIPRLAAVGDLYAATSRAYTALAGVLPETTEESSRG